MAVECTATDSGEKKQLGSKHFIIDVSPAMEPGQWPECCIYRVPELIRRVEKEAYTPKLLHIGPLHYSMQQPKDIEIQKLRYLKEFCDRTKKSQNDLARIIQSNELKIRRCYSESFDEINSEEFVKMILLDATFVIEFILRSKDSGGYEDHIITKPCLVYHIRNDLILLENQLPFFVLKKLYKFVLDEQENQQGEPPPSFLKLACNFLLKKQDVVPEGTEVKHLTDLHRTYFNLPEPSSKSPGITKAERFDEVWNATKLDEVGVKFKVAPDESRLLAVKFSKNNYLNWFPCLNLSWLLACLPCLKRFTFLEHMQPLLEIPRLVIEDGTESMFRNIMALEQCHYPSKAHFCDYIMLLDYIIDNAKDIELLVEKKIIVNMLGSNNAAATLINRLCLQIVTSESCYADVIKGLQRHYEDHWSRIMATLSSVYFGDFWRGAATVIGLLLLVNSLWGFLQPFVLKK